MKLIRSLDETPGELQGGAVSIGNFDGVHLGHARIVERLITAARRGGGPAVVFTFDPHPVRLLRPDQCPPPLTWTDRKADLLAEQGVDAMIAYPTDEALLQLSPREFFDDIILERLAARAMVEGPNFFFGHDRQGTIDVLRRFTEEAGLPLEVVEPLADGGEFISSSRVRRLIAAGDVAQARRMLTRPYRIRGMVTHGAGRGAKIGFPTANVAAIDTLLPAEGVYAGLAEVETPGEKAALWPAAVNVGKNPTFGEESLKVEAHLIGFCGDLYGKPLEVDFLRRLRDVRTFDAVEALTRQLANDVAAARREADSRTAVD